jgi:hypothetical protein
MLSQLSHSTCFSREIFFETPIIGFRVYAYCFISTSQRLGFYIRGSHRRRSTFSRLSQLISSSGVICEHDATVVIKGAHMSKRAVAMALNLPVLSQFHSSYTSQILSFRFLEDQDPSLELHVNSLKLLHSII